MENSQRIEPGIRRTKFVWEVIFCDHFLLFQRMSLFVRHGLTFCPKIGQPSSSFKFTFMNPNILRGSNDYHALCWRKEGSVSSGSQNILSTPSELMWKPSPRCFFSSSSFQISSQHSLLPLSSSFNHQTLPLVFEQRFGLLLNRREMSDTPDPDEILKKVLVPLF